MVLTAITGVTESSVVLRTNYGVVFQKATNVILAQDTWYHTYQIEFPDAIHAPSLPSCQNVNSTCQVISHVLTQLNSIRTETAIKVSNTVSTIIDLIPETHVHKSRSKRSLFPFLGKLAKGIFGTATTEDVNMLAKHMNKLVKMNVKFSQALSQHEDHLGSYNTSANHRMDNLMNGIKDNMLAIKYVNSQLYSTQHNIEQMFDYMFSILIDQIQTTNNLVTALEEFKIGIHDLVNGRLSPFLLPEHVVGDTLSDIQTILSTKFIEFQLSITNVKNVYSSCPFLYARNGTKLYITIKLPVSYYAKPLQSFEVLSFPVPINETAEHATQLLDLPEYFLITHERQHYASLSSKDLSACTGTNTKFCSKNVQLRPVTRISCVLALFTNEKDKVKSVCDFRLVQNIVQPKIIEISPSVLLIYRSPMLSMECLHKQKMVKGCDFCIFHLPCKCSLLTNDFFIAPRLGSCHENDRNLTIVHPVNLALLQHFSDSTFVIDIFADSTFQTPVNVTIPSLKLYEHQMSNVIAADSKAHLSLSKIAELARKDKTIFQSLTEPLLDGVIQIPSDWPTTNDVITYCSLSLSLVLTIILAWTILRVRKLMIIVAVLQNPKPCHTMAAKVPSFIYKSATSDKEINQF